MRESVMSKNVKFIDSENMNGNTFDFEIEQELADLTRESDWLTPFQLPEGHYTKSPKRTSKYSKDYAKTKMIRCFELKGKHVLDIGCSEGIYSFYMAEQGAKVMGVDIDEKRIRKANFIKKCLGFRNVQFETGNVLDPVYRLRLPHFDLVLAWGFLHRIPDPFNVLMTLGSLCQSLSLEWRAPSFLFPDGFSAAIHSPEGMFEWKNVSIIESNDTKIVNQKKPLVSGLADFWRLTPGAVAAITKRMGFDEFKVSTIKNETNVLQVAASYVKLIMRFIIRSYQPFAWAPSRRVHMLAERKPGQLAHHLLDSDELKVADWDGRFTG